MRYYRLAGSDGDTLAVSTDDACYDLSDARPGLDSLRELLAVSQVSGQPIDALAEDLLADATTLPRRTLTASAKRPFAPDEVWAAGVTYRISEQARKDESEKPEIYLDVYDADRPELFFKATESRTVGPGESIGIRGDSSWNVPEPELGIVLYHGAVVGYTIGNDVSSRSIEGENPLYLPQAKIYDRCCAIGPALATPDTVGDPHDLRMELTIVRDGEPVYTESAVTSEMVRTCEELVAYWIRHNTPPELAVLLTGTSLVPPDDFTLHVEDQVEIEIEHIGRLENGVIQV